MTLTAARNTDQIDGSAVPTVYERGAAVDVIYQGGMVCLNSSGYAEPAAANTGQSAVLGRAEATVDNSAGSAGDLNVEILCGQFKWDDDSSAMTIADEGKVCYAVDDESVSLSNAGGRPIAGIITRVDSDGVVVQHLYHVAALASSGAVAAGQALPRVYYARGASTANVASLAAFTVANDGITFVAGETVLLKDQATASQNGLYVCGTVGGGTCALTRISEFDDSTEVVSGAFVHVSEGTANADQWYTLTSNATLTVGTSNLAFTAMPTAVSLSSVETRLSSTEVVSSQGDSSLTLITSSIETRLSSTEVVDSQGDSSLTLITSSIETRLSSTEVVDSEADSSLTLITSSIETRLSSTEVVDSQGDSSLTLITSSIETRFSATEAAGPTVLRSLVVTSADLTTGGVGPETENIGAVLTHSEIVCGYRITLTDAFDNGAGVSLALEVGHDADPDAYEDGFDCYTGSTFEGAGACYATPGPGLGAPAFDGTATGQCVAVFTAGGDTLANFTNGSVLIEIIGFTV